MKRAALVILATLMLGFAAAAQEPPYLAVMAGDLGGCTFQALAYSTKWYGPGGSIDESDGYTVAAAPGGRVFAARRHPFRVDAFDVDEIGLGGFARPVAREIASGMEPPNALVVDAGGNMYVLARSPGPEVSHTIYALHAHGTLRATYPLGSLATRMDLAADQCTMFVATATGVRRMNVCTGASLPNVTTAGAFNVRVLPDGGLLVADGDSIDRHSAAGAVVRTYPIDRPPSAMSLAGGGETVWLVRSCRDDLAELDLQTGATRPILAQIGLNPNSVVPYHGWSAALRSFHAADVPAASQAALAALGVLLGLGALLRLR